jgi:type II pantothenate kinase
MLKLKNGEENKEKEDKEAKDGTKKEPLYVMATGGGAYKYFDKIQEKLGVKIYREDEMECLIVGMSNLFLSKTVDRFTLPLLWGCFF